VRRMSPHFSRLWVGGWTSVGNRHSELSHLTGEQAPPVVLHPAVPPRRIPLDQEADRCASAWAGGGASG